MILVLIVLGLAYGLAGPLFSEGSTGTQMRAAAHQISAGLRKARGIAIAQGHDAVLTLDLEARAFSVTGDSKIYKLPQPLHYRMFTAQAETITSRIGNIRFYPDGSSTGGRITVSDTGGSNQSVDVDWLTGRATVL